MSSPAIQKAQADSSLQIKHPGTLFCKGEYSIGHHHVNRRGVLLCSGGRAWAAEGRPCLLIRPSAIVPPAPPPSVSSLHFKTKHVPCSDHSSYTEIKQFLAVLRPRCLQPIIRRYKLADMRNRADMSQFNAYTQYPYNHKFEIPDEVVKFMDGPYILDARLMSGPIAGRIRSRKRKKPVGVIFADFSPTINEQTTQLTAQKIKNGTAEDCPIVATNSVQFKKNALIDNGHTDSRLPHFEDSTFTTPAFGHLSGQAPPTPSPSPTSMISAKKARKRFFYKMMPLKKPEIQAAVAAATKSVYERETLL
eukprot:m.76582 g.76582  ORF g.76582 m.76582 type:complete len:306 (+) comp36001_c0_seq32:734-1651(+)